MSERKQRRNMLRYASAGLEFTLALLVPMGAGLLLDWRLRTTPGYTLLGAAVGFWVGLRRLLRQAREIRRDAGGQGQGEPPC